MSYVVHEFENGEYLQDEQLNEMDAQIAQNAENIEEISGKMEETQIATLDQVIAYLNGNS